jgi:hypothetical protein
MVAVHTNRKSPRTRTPASSRPPGGGRDPKDDALRLDLFDFIRKLQLTLAVVMAAVKALEMQAAEQDEDIALVLKRHVGDALSRELEKWEAILQAQRRAGKGMRH